MTDKDIAKLAKVEGKHREETCISLKNSGDMCNLPIHIGAACPLNRPGFDALGMSAPVLVQMNPDGKWENCKPGNMDEERLRAVVAHLVNSKAVSAAQSYCGQCAVDNQDLSKGGGKSYYVPVIMMPIYPADLCPFNLECEIEKIKESEKVPRKRATTKEEEKDSSKEKDKKKLKKRSFTMQRLTDFDLLSQW